MTDHPTFPLWIYIAHDMADDTMFVVCHYHHKPDTLELDDMMKSVADYTQYTFHLAKVHPEI